MDKYLKNSYINNIEMFRRLINNNIKTIGIIRLSNDNNYHKIIQQLDEVNRTLNYIHLF